MQYKDITKFICSVCSQWRQGKKCQICNKSIKSGDTCAKVTKDSTIFDVYRPKRPKSMTPTKYYEIHGCVDENFKEPVRNKFYCNPAHCKKSFKSKEERDKHLKQAYGALV